MITNERIKNYWEDYADMFTETLRREIASSRPEAWRELILSNGPGREHMRILDVGTGPGLFPIILSQAGHEVTGIDITENMIARARENVAQAGQKATLLTMDSQVTTFPDGSFDMVVCRNLTWTLPDPPKAYREWYRLLNRGGRLIVFDACWYLWLFDEEERRRVAGYEESLNGLMEGELDEMSRQLFMSDKHRPQWDLEELSRIGFRRVFAELDLTDRIWGEAGPEKKSPLKEFLVGAEK
ncbi:MAG: class I SAM-dependent methyltransferase [Phoenicibacter congonensis]|uniref:Class I SAM-dependent methyltransferase n=1 Tax=Phoenicibacter congonensis TaxID=1944646 RepID=A0AA43RKG1_9ACTN|nr:class I SAM-dependent methyltransferase [Phoenicibacter congonensis]